MFPIFKTASFSVFSMEKKKERKGVHRAFPWMNYCSARWSLLLHVYYPPALSNTEIICMKPATYKVSKHHNSPVNICNTQQPAEVTDTTSNCYSFSN